MMQTLKSLFLKDIEDKKKLYIRNFCLAAFISAYHHTFCRERPHISKYSKQGHGSRRFSWMEWGFIHTDVQNWEPRCDDSMAKAIEQYFPGGTDVNKVF